MTVGRFIVASHPSRRPCHPYPLFSFDNAGIHALPKCSTPQFERQSATWSRQAVQFQAKLGINGNLQVCAHRTKDEGRQKRCTRKSSWHVQLLTSSGRSHNVLLFLINKYNERYIATVAVLLFRSSISPHLPPWPAPLAPPA